MALKYRGCQLGEDRAASGVWTGRIWGMDRCGLLVLPRCVAQVYREYASIAGRTQYPSGCARWWYVNGCKTGARGVVDRTE